MMLVSVLMTGTVWAGGDPARGAELASDCAGCHGEDGQGDEDFPSIAGMDAAALAKTLADYKSGMLESEEMADFTADLSEQDMADLAAYFSALDK